MRKKYLDGLKLVAIFIIFATHFLAFFNEGFFERLAGTPLAFLEAFSGKLGVIIFSIVLGYLAYRSSEERVAVYSAKRYIYFFICALFANVLYGACGFMIKAETAHSLLEILRESILLSDKFFPAFWCIERFFIASVFSRINGKARLGTAAILAEIGILLWWGHIWTAICIMGNIVAVIEKQDRVNRIAESRLCRIAIYLIALVLINIPESKTSYVISGFCVVLVVTALAHSRLLKRVLEQKALSSLGKHSMTIFLLHVFIYQLVGELIFNSFERNPLSFTIAFIGSWLIIVLLSVLLTPVINRLHKTICIPIDILAERFNIMINEANPEAVDQIEKESINTKQKRKSEDEGNN